MEEARQGAGFPGDSAPVLNIRADLQIEDKFGSSAQMVLLACFGWSSLSMSYEGC